MIQLPATLCYLTDPQGVFPDQKFNAGCADQGNTMWTSSVPPHYIRIHTNPPTKDSERVSCTSCRGLGLNHRPKPAPDDENSESGRLRMD